MKRIILLALALVMMTLSIGGCFVGWDEGGRSGRGGEHERGGEHDRGGHGEHERH